ncbi:uncharacterized protein [Acropora muricata]|uniref:uncharacterized protein n=1 Tax=Acropora muricata TaxID=159855 RepID=UPI0034E5845B
MFKINTLPINESALVFQPKRHLSSLEILVSQLSRSVFDVPKYIPIIFVFLNQVRPSGLSCQSLQAPSHKASVLERFSFAPEPDSKIEITLKSAIEELSSLTKTAISSAYWDTCKKLASRIAVLRKIRTYLPLPERIQYYNSIISLVMSYVSAIWSNCDKELFFRVFKLQKHAARVILYAERMAPSVELFNRLKWIPFYKKCKIDKASIMFKRIHGVLPSYLNEHILINNSRHSRTTRYSNFNVLCPRYNRETEGGRTFLVTGTKIWNELPLRIRMADSIRCFKHNMWTNIFSQQQFLSHFCV